MHEDLLKQMQQAVENGKKNLDHLTVYGEAGGGLVRIELTGNRQLKSLQINTDLEHIDKEDLEDFLAVALNKALIAADDLHEQEMARNARLFMP